MTDTVTFEPGGYRYAPFQFQYSCGVAAEPGFIIERARFARPVPLEDGFRRIEAHLGAVSRPLTAFCACELRSPEPFTDQGFIDFNRIYVGTLERWGIFKDDDNPVARTNVCPPLDAPSEPSFHAFSYTVPSDGPAGPPSFVVSGAGEAPTGPGDYKERIIRLGDTSTEAMREKARFVLGAMEQRMKPLGVGWPDVTLTHAYTIENLHPFLADEILARGAAADGLTWVYALPPVIGLNYEMDVMGVTREIVLPA
jgi:hypothetical protein